MAWPGHACPGKKGKTVQKYSSRAPEVKSLVTDEALVRERRAQIVAGAVRLFSQKGYDRTTVQQVAKKAGVSTGLIYQYVHEKEDLLLLSILDVVDSYALEIPAALEGVERPLDRCSAAFAAYCRVVDARRAATLLAYRSTISLSRRRQQLIKDAELETNALIGGCIQDCIDQGLFRDIDTDLATYQLVMYAHAWALKHWHFAKRIDLETYISQGLDLFLHGLLTDKGRKQLKRQAASSGKTVSAGKR
jgi:AcrR family transcriptional regulator